MRYFILSVITVFLLGINAEAMTRGLAAGDIPMKRLREGSFIYEQAKLSGLKPGPSS